MRTNIENINKGNPLTERLFKDFEDQYQQQPRKENPRFRTFTKEDIEKRNYNLDIFWLRSDSLDIGLEDPYVLVNEIATSLELTLQSINHIKLKLEESGR